MKEHDEFLKWLSDFGKRFPSMAKWFNDLNGPDGDGDIKQFQFDEGEKVLGDVDYRDASAVNRLMYAAVGEYDSNGRWRGDDFPPIGTFTSQRERWAVHVRSLAMILKRRRENADKPKEATAEPIFIRQTEKHTGVLAKVNELKEAGLSTSEAVDHVFGPVDPEDEPRFTCLFCRDTGRVHIWRTPYCYKAWLAGVINEPKHHKTQSRPCSCSRGARFVPDTLAIHNKSRDWYRYNPRRDCLTGSLEDFIVWCENRKDFEAWHEQQRYELEHPEETKELFTRETP